MTAKISCGMCGGCGQMIGCIYCGSSGYLDDSAAPAEKGLTIDALQKKTIEYGFVYWRAPDAHGVVGTIKQAEDLIADLIGVEVEIKNDAR